MARRRFPWMTALLVGGGALLAALTGAWLYAMQAAVHAYYRGAHAPEAIAAAELGDPPATHRLGDVPWLSEPTASCHSLSLRMLAAQQGRDAPRPELDFLLGVTWGAVASPGRTGFSPGQDPEPGFLRAAPHLGFRRRLLTTDERAEFLRAVQTQLAAGRAVRVAVDRAALEGRSGFEPHSVVLVGYDAERVEFYEPVCDEPRRCTPGVRAPGEPGLFVSIERFVMAVEVHALAFRTPWTYQLLVLEPVPGERPSPRALLEANGRALMGTRSAGPSTGAQVVRDTASALERHGDSVVTPELRRGVGAAANARRDDAEALASLFPGRADLTAATERLVAAAAAYERAAAALDAREVERAVQALRDAALADLEAGAALVGADDGGA